MLQRLAPTQWNLLHLVDLCAMLEHGSGCEVMGKLGAI